MWITHFNFFYEFQKADFLLIFQHFYGILLDIDGLLHYNQYAIFRKEGAFFMRPNDEKYVYLFI